MDYETELHEALASYKEGKLNDKEIVEIFQRLSVTDLGYAKVDHGRSLRRGFPEVVYCEGKSISQAVGILKELHAHHSNILGTRASRNLYDKVKEIIPEARYDETARLILVEKEPLPKDPLHKIAVITAGTSDIPVAEEAALTAELMGQ